MSGKDSPFERLTKKHPILHSALTLLVLTILVALILGGLFALLGTDSTAFVGGFSG